MLSACGRWLSIVLIILFIVGGGFVEYEEKGERTTVAARRTDSPARVYTTQFIPMPSFLFLAVAPFNTRAYTLSFESHYTAMKI